MHDRYQKQTGHALIGYLFIGYTFFTLALTLGLSNPRPINSEPEAQELKQMTSSEKPAVIKPMHPHNKPTIEAPPRAAKITTTKYPSRPDFGVIKDIKTKKEAFFEYLAPAIERENKRMAHAQQQLRDMQSSTQAKQPLSAQQQRTLHQWSKDYRVDTTAPAATQLVQLLERMDVIPASMVMAQAAMESAWGTSRFARLANNYFGQWCFRKGCGIVPSQRNTEASHEVATFTDAQAAVASYFKNINRHPAYQRVREERLALRRSGEPLDSLVMVRGLDQYSARGHAYIEELQSMIRYNKIKRFD